MQKTLMSIAMMLLGMAAFAQQSLSGGAAVVSPELNPDKTVTFRLVAPKARQVEVTGDFLPAQKVTMTRNGVEYTAEVPGVAELVEKNGVWEFTTAGPLEPELYYYHFVVDGLRINDPSNVYMIRDVSNVMSIFLVEDESGARGNLYSVHDVPHGAVTRLWYHSDILDAPRRMTVYTPAGYEDGKDRYPVLYLLHGTGGDEEAWSALGRTAQILDNLIAQGKAKPMIVVMPNGHAGLEAAAGESHYGLVPPSMGARADQMETASGAFEATFPEIVKYIDSHYRTIAKKSGRAITGLSMGSGHSFNISKEYPDMFDYIGHFSGGHALGSYKAESFPLQVPDDAEVYRNTEEKLAVQFSKNPKLYFIACGNTDFLFGMNKAFRAYFDEMGYPYTYFESDGGHIWKNWRIYLTEFVPLLFK